MCVHVCVLDGRTHSLIFPDSEKKPVKGCVHNPTSIRCGLHIYPSTLSVHTQLVCLCMHIENGWKICGNAFELALVFTFRFDLTDSRVDSLSELFFLFCVPTTNISPCLEGCVEMMRQLF